MDEIKDSDMVNAIEVWVDDDGKLIEGPVEYRHWVKCFSNPAEVLKQIQSIPGVHVYMELYGFNLTTLREAF